MLELAGSDGAIGLGEASPLPGFSNESLEEAAEQLTHLASSMQGLEVTEDCVNPEGDLSRELEGMGLAPSVRFGFELALYNTCAESKGETLPHMISPAPVDSVPINSLISGSHEETLRRTRQALDAGYLTFKLKVGSQNVERDVDLTRAVSGILGDAGSLRLDANRAWSFEEAAAFACATADVEYEYVEEPLADPAGLPELALEYGMPMALDESLVGMDPESLEGHRYARAVVLKPTLLGGLTPTLRLARRAKNLGVVPVISAAYETGVGTLGLVALAAGLGGAVPAGLDTYRRLAADVLAPPPELAAPIVDVPGVFAGQRSLDKGRLEPVQT